MRSLSNTKEVTISTFLFLMMLMFVFGLLFGQWSAEVQDQKKVEQKAFEIATNLTCIGTRYMYIPTENNTQGEEKWIKIK